MALVTREVSYRCSDDCKMSGCPGHVGRLAYHSVSDHYGFNMDGNVYSFERGELEAMILMLRSLNRADAIDLDSPELKPPTTKDQP